MHAIPAVAAVEKKKKKKKEGSLQGHTKCKMQRHTALSPSSRVNERVRVRVCVCVCMCVPPLLDLFFSVLSRKIKL